MDRTDILVFDVGMGQSIFVYPRGHPEYGMLIDAGNTPDFEPVDFLLRKGFIANNTLSNLTLTNYDQDHYSGLPYLRTKVAIRSVSFAANLTSSEIRALKQQPHTDALAHALDIKDKYTYPAQDYRPPYVTTIFALGKSDLDALDTNNLSQVVFVEHNDSVVCVAGDLEEKGWVTLLNKQPVIKTFLMRTNVFVASHHGRQNSYHPAIFAHCSPECIVISDKGIVHDTQRDMSAVYGTHVKSGGVVLDGEARNRRKVLTTRSDGHLWIQLHPGGAREYRSFKHE